MTKDWANAVLVDEAVSVQRHTFRAMGTTVGVVTSAQVDGAASLEAIRGVESTFRAYEERFSRFLEASELSEVNRRSGSWTRVSDEFSSMLAAALDGARRTDGLFDPTVLPALTAAGYDRDFDDVIAGARDVLRTVAPCGRWADVELDGNMVLMPPDVALDFGGIAKGWTVDVAAELVSNAVPWVLVEAGGDLRVEGEVDEPGLEIALEDPRRSHRGAAAVPAPPRIARDVIRDETGVGSGPPSPDRPAHRPTVTHRRRAGHDVGAELRGGRGSLDLGAARGPADPPPHPGDARAR